MSVKRMRGGSGLGDALYIRPIAEHLLVEKHDVTVCTSWPDVYHGLPCTLEPFRKDNVNVVCHYVVGKYNTTTNQWQDICDCAKVTRLALQFKWPIQNLELIDKIRAEADGRPIVLIHGGRAPMDRVDGFGLELMPERRAFELVNAAVRGDVFLVRFGAGEAKHEVGNVDVDLWGKTSVMDTLDLGRACDAIIGPCSFCVPLAECFDKPFLAVWSASGMAPNRHPYIKSITPSKVLSKPTSLHVVDDWVGAKITEGARAFRALF